MVYEIKWSPNLLERVCESKMPRKIPRYAISDTLAYIKDVPQIPINLSEKLEKPILIGNPKLDARSSSAKVILNDTLFISRKFSREIHINSLDPGSDEEKFVLKVDYNRSLKDVYEDDGKLLFLFSVHDHVDYYKIELYDENNQVLHTQTLHYDASLDLLVEIDGSISTVCKKGFTVYNFYNSTISCLCEKVSIFGETCTIFNYTVIKGPVPHVIYTKGTRTYLVPLTNELLYTDFNSKCPEVVPSLVLVDMIKLIPVKMNFDYLYLAEECYDYDINKYKSILYKCPLPSKAKSARSVQ